MKYRRIPEIVDAFRFGYDEEPEWFKDAMKTGRIDYYYKGKEPIGGILYMYDGETFNKGDWLVKGRDVPSAPVDGRCVMLPHCYVCKDEAFGLFFEKA